MDAYFNDVDDEMIVELADEVEKNKFEVVANEDVNYIDDSVLVELTDDVENVSDSVDVTIVLVSY